MSFEKPNIDEPKVLKADNYEFKIGDSVSVVRSDGHVEDDWTLFSFGNRCAVVHKGSGDRTLQKVIDLKEFKRIQIRAKEGDPQKPRPGRRIVLGRPDIRELAEKVGIDTTVEGWEEIWKKKMREASGV